MLKLQQHKEHQNKQVAGCGGELILWNTFILSYSQMWLDCESQTRGRGLGVLFFPCNRKFANVFSPLLYLKSDTNITISISILFIDCYYYYYYQKGCSVSNKSLHALIKHLKINGTSENKLWKESFTSNLWSLLMGFLKLK